MSASSVRVTGLSVFLAFVVLLSLVRYVHGLAMLLSDAPFLDSAHTTPTPARCVWATLPSILRPWPR